MSIRSDYQRARRNALARYNRLLNKGYQYSENPIPAIPKNITRASINRLNKLTARVLRERAESGVDVNTGEVVTPKQAYISQRRETARRQSRVQRKIAHEHKFKEEYAFKILQRPREKGESYNDYYSDAISTEAYYLYEEAKELDELDNDWEEVNNTPFSEPQMSPDQYETEIENAYDSGEYETARELEKERDYYYGPEEENIARLSYEDRFLDAIEIIKQYSPEMAEKLEESFNYYMSRKGGEAFESGLTGTQLKDMEDALDKLEDTKYKSNAFATWQIYTKMDKAINSRHHSRAERNAFMGRLQSGDFQYE